VAPPRRVQEGLNEAVVIVAPDSSSDNHAAALSGSVANS